MFLTSHLLSLFTIICLFTFSNYGCLLHLVTYVGQWVCLTWGILFIFQCSACAYRAGRCLPGMVFEWMFYEVWCYNTWLNTLESLLIIDVSLWMGKHCQFQLGFSKFTFIHSVPSSLGLIPLPVSNLCHTEC